MIGHLARNGDAHPGPARVCRICSRLRSRRRKTTNQRGYTYQWRKAVAAAIAAHPFCRYCGATDDLTGDHVVPVSRGGTTADGIIVACRSCNSSRGNKAAFFGRDGPRPLARFSRNTLRPPSIG